jgi:hypothetical protein
MPGAPVPGGPGEPPNTPYGETAGPKPIWPDPPIEEEVQAKDGKHRKRNRGGGSVDPNFAAEGWDGAGDESPEGYYVLSDTEMNVVSAGVDGAVKFVKEVPGLMEDAARNLHGKELHAIRRALKYRATGLRTLFKTNLAKAAPVIVTLLMTSVDYEMNRAAGDDPATAVKRTALSTAGGALGFASGGFVGAVIGAPLVPETGPGAVLVPLGLGMTFGVVFAEYADGLGDQWLGKPGEGNGGSQ